ncbi:MAG TPA: GNAT family N-acetyltransferase [Streptosporangiaceae bacterium]|nr:GNAT family N-acetyltransferase [Streptosporangiaceae bacterium]
MSSNVGPAIREARRGDAQQIAALLTQLGYPSTREQVGQRLAYWLPDPMSLILVAEHGGRIEGCLSLHAIPYLERTGRWARIESLVVAESCRGRGTGRSLVAAAERAATQAGCLTVEVTSARTRVSAHAFYERMGYTDICDSSGRFLKTLSDAAVSSFSHALRRWQ